MVQTLGFLLLRCGTGSGCFKWTSKLVESDSLVFLDEDSGDASDLELACLRVVLNDGSTESTDPQRARERVGRCGASGSTSLIVPSASVVMALEAFFSTSEEFTSLTSDDSCRAIVSWYLQIPTR